MELVKKEVDLMSFSLKNTLKHFDQTHTSAEKTTLETTERANGTTAAHLQLRIMYAFISGVSL